MDIDLDLSGHLEVQEALEELEEDWSDAPTYEVYNPTEYGPYLELGTRYMPPYPFFRPAINEYMASPDALARKQQGIGLKETSTVDELVYLLTVSLNQQIEDNLRAGESARRSPGTHPEHPKTPTGNLLGNQKYRRL